MNYTSVFACALVAGTVLFNAVLAYINGAVMPLGRAHVVLAEVLIIASALGLVSVRFQPQVMLPWLLLIMFFFGLFLLVGLLNGVLDPKIARDIMIAPVFILLGTLCTTGQVIRTVVLLQIVLLLVLLVEALRPELYGEIFNVVQYYINTRGIEDDAFWMEDSKLFISAYRPEQRYLFEWLDIHRLSTVFLEPVSLGNYCIILTMIFLALWPEMRLGTKAFLAASTLVLLVGSDGRLAAVTSFLLVLGAPLFLWVPRRLPLLYPPLCLLIAGLLIVNFDWQPGPDNFQGRTARSIALLTSLDLMELLGRWDRLPRFADSGVTYFIASQSMIGVLVFWFTTVLIPPMRERGEIIFVHCVWFYISCNLLVSYSLFSIKTAALMWFVYGVLYARALDLQPSLQLQTPEPEPPRPRPRFEAPGLRLRPGPRA